jgi:hypothetical protein
VAQRHGGGDAGLAGIDHAAALGGQSAEVEKIDLETAGLLNQLARHARQAEGFRHFARAGLIAARRAVDDQDARRRFRVLLPLLRRLDLAAAFDPFERQIVFRVGIAGAGRPRAGAFAVGLIGFPGHVDELVDLGFELGEGRVVESLAIARCEFRPVDLHRRHALADFDLGLGHGGPFLLQATAIAAHRPLSVQPAEAIRASLAQS